MGNDKFTLDVGLALDLKLAFARNGWSEAEVKKLTGGDFLKGVRDVLCDRAEIKPVEHVIDCDATPFTPAGWSIRPEDQLPKAIRGLVKWNRGDIRHYYPEKRSRGWVRGYELRKELESQAVYTANVLDYLLDNPRLIPEEWKEKAIYFWGTIYRGSDGCLCIRCLSLIGGRWFWRYSRLVGDWHFSHPTAVRAS